MTVEITETKIITRNLTQVEYLYIGLIKESKYNENGELREGNSMFIWEANNAMNLKKYIKDSYNFTSVKDLIWGTGKFRILITREATVEEKEAYYFCKYRENSDYETQSAYDSIKYGVCKEILSGKEVKVTE